MYYEAEERETINGYCVPVLINVSYHITHEFRSIDPFRYKEKTKCTMTIKKETINGHCVPVPGVVSYHITHQFLQLELAKVTIIRLDIRYPFKRLYVIQVISAKK